MKTYDYGVLYLYCGLGGATVGMQQAVEDLRGIKGRFYTIAAIDCDSEACEDFKMLTGTKATNMDLFSWEDYIAYHGKNPPPEWKEATPQDIFNACGGIAPDVVFMSPPCKGFSGLLPEKSARSEKYQALNRLVIRGLALLLAAFPEDPPAIILLENVPRITTRGVDLLKQVKGMLRRYGYIFTPSKHDCGELGGLGQHRQRFLLISRLPEKVPTFIYEPFKMRVKAVGEIIGPMPMPDDLVGGPMHRLPRLQWKTWMRLALIPAGGDWRDLERIAPEQYRLEYLPRGGGPFGVQKWEQPGATVIGKAGSRGSNAAAIADPRLTERDGRHPGVYQVVQFDEPGPCVTGTRFGSGAPAIADPRTGFKVNTHHAIYRVGQWDEASRTVTGAYRPNNGAITVADPRLECKCRDGTMGVQRWDEPGKTVTGTGDIHSGATAIADPRIPKGNEQGIWVIIAPDGTWHRPLTTLELAALQGLPTQMPDGKPLILSGKSDARWRERIGNAVPPPTAKAIGEVILRALLLSKLGEWELSATPIWVTPERIRSNYNESINRL